jgi:hypothetical protein
MFSGLGNDWPGLFVPLMRVPRQQFLVLDGGYAARQRRLANGKDWWDVAFFMSAADAFYGSFTYWRN